MEIEFATSFHDFISDSLFEEPEEPEVWKIHSFL